MVSMKYKNYSIIIFLLFFCVSSVYAENMVFDYKYVKVGVVCNQWDNQLGSSPNIRQLGTTTSPEHYGKNVLDKLLCKDANGELHIEQLWSEALNNTILEEEEIAELDASAAKNDVLKKDISRQLLKNNYIVILEKKEKKSSFKENLKAFASGFTGKDIESYDYKYRWKVYYVDITDEIIDQAYLNWDNPSAYEQIKVNVKYIAKGVCDPQRLIFSIAKKVPAFAIRGTIASIHPTYAKISKSQGVKKMDIVNIYGVYSDRKGNLQSRRKGTTRVTIPDIDSTKLLSISGRTPSLKNGDIAVLRSRDRSGISLLGQGSFGNDPRYGGRFMYDYMFAFSKHGIAQYFLLSGTYNTFKKEPEGYWWEEIANNEYQVVTPRLSSFDLSLGYGVGFIFLNCLELRPYILLGWDSKYISTKGGIYWDQDANEGQGDWGVNYGWFQFNPMNFIGYAGVQLNLSICYPLQFIVGADYNFGIQAKGHKIYDSHKQQRLNLYTGFRVNF